MSATGESRHANLQGAIRVVTDIVAKVLDCPALNFLL
jgi:hypothetical protein